MAIATVVKVKYKCGHQEDADLSHIPAGRRKAHAYGLSKNRVCKSCFTKTQKKDTADWLAKKNAQELLDADQFEEEHQLLALQGSEKQVPWGTRERHHLLAAALELHKEAGESADQILEAARLITRAGWWIDAAGTEDEDVFELVTTAEPTAEVDESENPF